MKVKLIALAIICLLALSLAACTQSGKQDSISLTYDDFTPNKINRVPSKRTRAIK